jgi:hypothetical protein
MMVVPIHVGKKNLSADGQLWPKYVKNE